VTSAQATVVAVVAILAFWIVGAYNRMVRLRSALVECAWRLVRFQPGYPPVQKRLPILAKGARATGAARKKAIVAVARQLAVDLWRWQTGQCSATQLGLHP